jgi:hypothetical protein
MLPPDCVAWRHSLVLLPHLSVLPFGSLPSYRCALSTGPTLKRRLAEAACPFSISGLNHPSYALLAKCRKSLPGSFEVPSAGFGYPLDGVSRSNPWKLLSAPNALGIPSSELSSFRMIQIAFPRLVPFLHFPKKPPSLLGVLQWLSPIRKAVPLTCSPKD